MTKHMREEMAFCQMPSWVPNFAVRYLAHTESGIPIRELARDADVHASTVLRQIRRVESRRDDPLIDEALSDLGAIVACARTGATSQSARDMVLQSHGAVLSDRALKREAKDVLSKLSEAGAVLAFAADMEKAVVVRDLSDGATQRTAVVDRKLAQAMALKDWISCKSPGRISRYQITPEGREELGKIIAMEDGADGGPEESLTRKLARRARFATSEGPVTMLARRKDKGGKPFLSADLVAASERLREDFELCQISGSITQNWDHFLTAGTGSGQQADRPIAACDAKRRLDAALNMLGEGLADVALRCCCHQDGMETVEKRLGWPARSGKVVLRIALIRLREHYAANGGWDRNMIG